MKKTFIFLLFALWSYTLQAQIVAFNNAAQNNFYGIGGYSFSQFTFPIDLQNTPYVVSGPSPQNDFSYAITASGGAINNATGGVISTVNANDNIFLEMKGNNVRKFACKVYAYDTNPNVSSGNIISVVASTNLGNQITQTNSTGQFVGFNVTGSENEYIVSVLVQFQSTPSPARRIALYSIMVGDNSPQNVALNFDGSNDYVSIPSNIGNFATNDDFTVTCWIKPDPTQTTQSGQNPSENDIISKWAGFASGPNNNYPFVIRYLNQTRTPIAERGKILVGQWDGTTFTTLISTTAVNDGQWHHVAFVRESGTFKLYINGNPEGSVADNVNNATNNTTPLQFGRRGNNESYFKGEIDEVRIWTVAKTAAQIANERFCKTPDATNLQASYSFSNGVPHGDNSTFSLQAQNGVGTTNNGTLNGFANTGDVSNFVTGQVKYVKRDAIGTQNGSSWANALISLQLALPSATCNDLFEVFVAKGRYRPDFPTSGNVNLSFNILTGMRIYGGFAGTEKSINQRNLARIHTTNKTTLSGDLENNYDEEFNFTTNRTDNSIDVVRITGNNTLFDGFTVRGGQTNGLSITISVTNNLIKNSRFIDNGYGMTHYGITSTISNCSFLGNATIGIQLINASATINNSLIANIGNKGIFMTANSGTRQVYITNCTIAANPTNGIGIQNDGATINYTIKNTINYGNGFDGLVLQNNSGTTNSDISNSLIQGRIDITNGNLSGTTNPQFVSPLSTGIGSLTANPDYLGDYRLKWCSYAIGAGTNTGISPLDLDRNPRNFNTTADMGAYEFLGNVPSQANNSSIVGTIDSPTYLGGAIQTITSTAKVLAPAGAIDFIAPNSIILSPGFEARGVGKYFKAEIGGNVGCSN